MLAAYGRMPVYQPRTGTTRPFTGYGGINNRDYLVPGQKPPVPAQQPPRVPTTSGPVPEGPGSIASPVAPVPRPRGVTAPNDMLLPPAPAAGPVAGGMDGYAQRNPGLFPQPNAPWQPYMASMPTPAMPVAGPKSRGPMLAFNAPQYKQGNGLTLEPGQWHNSPGYIGNSGTVWNKFEPGSQHYGPGYTQTGPGQSLGGAATGGGGGGYQGGGSLMAGFNPLAEWQRAMDEANAANRTRQNNITSGYEAMKNYIDQQSALLGAQQRADINTSFDKARGGMDQELISRGLMGSNRNTNTLLQNMLKGNERTRGESLARLDDKLISDAMDRKLPVWGKQLDFLNSITEQGPNMGLMAQLLKEAAASGGLGGGGGGGMGGFVDMGGADFGYGLGFNPLGMMGYGGMMNMPWRQGGGQTYFGGSGGGTSGNSVLDRLLRGRGGGAREPDLILRGGDPIGDFFNRAPGERQVYERPIYNTPMTTVPMSDSGVQFNNGPSVPPGMFDMFGPINMQPDVGTRKRNQLGEAYEYDGTDWRRA